MNYEERQDQAKADEVFDALDDYSKGQLAALGTAFTTYEDLGDNVCRWLNARANSWRAAQMTRAGL